MFRGIRSSVLLTLAVGCQPQLHPQVSVTITVDGAALARADEIQVLVFDNDGAMVFEETSALGGRASVSLPVITAVGGDDTRVFRVSSTLMDEGIGFNFISARASYVAGTLSFLELHHASGCDDVMCGLGATCLDGFCVGSCYTPIVEDGVRTVPSCTECQRCGLDESGPVTCQPVSGEACGCGAGTCNTEGECAGQPRFAFADGGRDQTCAMADERLYCWGSNASGQLRTDDPNEMGPRELVEEGVVSLATGVAFVCSVNRENVLRCWGTNGEGELSIPIDGTAHTTPEVVAVDAAVEVAAGNFFACARLADGTIWCWGECEHGETGLLGCIGMDHIGASPTQIMVPPSDGICTGATHACALVAGEAWCWGANMGRQLGRVENEMAGPTFRPQTPQVEPLRVVSSEATPVTDLACAGFSTCALHASGHVWCWGQQPLVGGTQNYARVERSGEALVFRALDCGLRHCCGIERDTHRLYCWGNNDAHQLGVEGEINDSSPRLVAGHREWESVGVGSLHTCATELTTEALWCWGDNGLGQVEPGSAATISSPTRLCIPE